MGAARKIIALSVLPFLFSCSSSSISPLSGDPVIEALHSVSTALPPVQLASRSQVEAHGTKWMVSTQGKYATQAANEILKKGGNLIDAAIVASLVVSVERPQSTGLGGGGFLIYHEGASGKNFVFDFRERAPLKAKKDMYLDRSGNVIEDLSTVGGLSVATPGLIRGLMMVHEKFGKVEWQKLFSPAIKLAEDGFPVYPYLANALKEERADLEKFPESKKLFLHEDGSPLQLGELLVQKNLARTLKTLSTHPEDFYTGKIARSIVKATQETNGILSMEDLAQYGVKERSAVHSYWRGYELISMPPPSSGGIHVIQILKMLEKDALSSAQFQTPEMLNLEAQAMQQAFADRAKYLGDPDFVKVPVAGLLNNQYLANLRSRFTDHARNAADVQPGVMPKKEKVETTHFSMMNSAGDVVVSTQTINGWFGSHVVAGDTGIVLNDEMDDFSTKPGAANMFGAIGTTESNSIAPKKTPLSSMSPTIVLKQGEPVMAIGSPGGTRIITAVAQTILNHLAFKKDLFTSIAAPRIHEQWMPNVLFIENQPIPVPTLRSLARWGWKIERVPAQSNVQAVCFDEKEGFTGVADPRDIGTSAGD